MTALAHNGRAVWVEVGGRRVRRHRCDGCGAVEPWGDGWAWVSPMGMGDEWRSYCAWCAKEER